MTTFICTVDEQGLPHTISYKESKIYQPRVEIERTQQCTIKNYVRCQEEAVAMNKELHAMQHRVMYNKTQAPYIVTLCTYIHTRHLYQYNCKVEADAVAIQARGIITLLKSQSYKPSLLAYQYQCTNEWSIHAVFTCFARKNVLYVCMQCGLQCCINNHWTTVHHSQTQFYLQGM